MSFGQKAFAKAAEDEETIVDIPEVIVEKKTFFGWLKGLFV